MMDAIAHKNSAVIVRLDRTIQYAATLAFRPRHLRLMDTRWSLSSGSPLARPGGGYDAREGLTNKRTTGN
jgi:hypothetical protein